MLSPDKRKEMSQCQPHSLELQEVYVAHLHLQESTSNRKLPGIGLAFSSPNSTLHILATEAHKALVGPWATSRRWARSLGLSGRVEVVEQVIEQSLRVASPLSPEPLGHRTADRGWVSGGLALLGSSLRFRGRRSPSPRTLELRRLTALRLGLHWVFGVAVRGLSGVNCSIIKSSSSSDGRLMGSSPESGDSTRWSPEAPRPGSERGCSASICMDQLSSVKVTPHGLYSDSISDTGMVTPITGFPPARLASLLRRVFSDRRAQWSQVTVSATASRACCSPRHKAGRVGICSGNIVPTSAQP
uniref:Uncharacterized protein n=1 Tax=Knipowitschia caucasica TaxID=637954 RepID=A0AAV2JKN3_KNICA